MSMELMVKAMKLKVGNPLRKLVLLKLADNANDQGECWPSYQHIADQCEIGRSTVKSHVRALEEMGMLRREYRRNGDQNQSNLFHLRLDEKEYKQPSKSGAGAAPGQELPPESVTLLNQSMNQSMNLILLAHRLKPLSRHALVSRIIHLNLKLPGRHIQNVLVAILSLQPGKHGRPVSVRALNPLTCWQAYSAMQDTSLPLGKPGLST